MPELTDRPERIMVRRAVVPAFVIAITALCLSWIAGGAGAGASAAIGAAVVFVNLAAHLFSLSWASRISIPALQAVALLGVAVRLGIIVVLMFALNQLSWFSPLAFGLTVVPATLLLLAYEASLTMRGVGAVLQIPADPAAVRAAQMRTARGI